MTSGPPIFFTVPPTFSPGVDPGPASFTKSDNNLTWKSWFLKSQATLLFVQWSLQRNHQCFTSLTLCEGNPSLTSDPSQRASNGGTYTHELSCCWAETGGFWHCRSHTIGVHTCSVGWRVDLPFWWGQKWFGACGFKADVENLVLDPFVLEQILLPLYFCSTTTHVWIHVMIYIETNFLPVSPCVGSAHMSIPLNVSIWCHHVFIWMYSQSPMIIILACI